MEHQRVPKNTVRKSDEHWCTSGMQNSSVYPQINSRWSPFPLHWLHRYPVSHRIQYKWLDFLEETTEILWDTRLKSIWIFISPQQLEESSMHHISSQEESSFPFFDWRGEPVFHKHLKWSFHSAIGRWEGLCAFCLNWNIPQDAWLKRRPDCPAVA